MIKTLKITNHIGETLLLELRSPERSGFFVKNLDGIGPPKSIVNFTESLSIDGGYFNSSRISMRNMVLDLGFFDGYGDLIETTRQQTYRFFPMKKLLHLEIETDNRIGMTDFYVESNEPDIFSKEGSTQISMLSPNSFFYGDIIDTIFSGIDSLFEFPFSNESLSAKVIEFGYIYNLTEKSVVYEGDEETGVVIYINFIGAVHNLSVHNITLSQSMVISSSNLILITGGDFQAGDQLIISTLRGSKYLKLIRAGIEYNILNALDLNGIWFTLQKGDNLFSYMADSGSGNIHFTIEHQILYEGM